jgi:hypothetical protein
MKTMKHIHYLAHSRSCLGLKVKNNYSLFGLDSFMFGHMLFERNTFMFGSQEKNKNKTKKKLITIILAYLVIIDPPSIVCHARYTRVWLR